MGEKQHIWGTFDPVSQSPSSGKRLLRMLPPHAREKWESSAASSNESTFWASSPSFLRIINSHLSNRGSFSSIWENVTLHMIPCGSIMCSSISYPVEAPPPPDAHCTCLLLSFFSLTTNIYLCTFIHAYTTKSIVCHVLIHFPIQMFLACKSSNG